MFFSGGGRIVVIITRWDLDLSELTKLWDSGDKPGLIYAPNPYIPNPCIPNPYIPNVWV